MYRFILEFSKKNLAGLLFILFFFNLFSGANLNAQSEGEELFKVCAACHTIGGGKLIGPDLQGVTERLDREWLIPFILNSTEVIQSGDEYAVKIFEENNKIPMPPNDYTDAQVNAVIDYIENYGKEDASAPLAATDEHVEDDHAVVEVDFMAETEHPYGNVWITFVISMVLILVCLFDLMVTKFIKARFIHLIVILISLFVVGEIIVVEAQNLGRQQYYEPDQPILFSHKVHAGENQIDCQYCHFTSEQSRHAGIPPMQVCLNCHNVIREGTHTGKEEIAKIHQSIQDGKPVEWIKVHNLPDHVYFNHAQHVKIGKLDCTECHGDVENMDRIMQVESLGMGWCIECHRNTGVQFIDNDFYLSYKQTHEKLESGEISKVTVDNIGGNECQKCHY